MVFILRWPLNTRLSVNQVNKISLIMLSPHFFFEEVWRYLKFADTLMKPFIYRPVLSNAVIDWYNSAKSCNYIWLCLAIASEQIFNCFSDVTPTDPRRWKCECEIKLVQHQRKYFSAFGKHYSWHLPDSQSLRRPIVLIF